MNLPPIKYTTTADGMRIAYTMAGDGVPLIFLPALWSHFSAQWTHELQGQLFEAFARRFKLVLFDSRGQGLSTRGLPEATTIEDYERDLDAVIDAVSPQERFVLFAVSLRALVAIRYCVKHPERVIALITWNYRDASFASFAGPMWELAAQDWEFFMATVARLGFPTKDPELVKEVMRETMSQADHITQGRVLRSASSADLLPGLSVPSLVLASRMDGRAFPHEEGGRWLAQRIPGSQLRFFEGASGGLDVVDGQPPPAVVAIEEFVHGLAALPAPDGLTRRELEVLRLLAGGHSNRDIATALTISLSTAAKHVNAILTKTGAANRTQAAAYAHRLRLV